MMYLRENVQPISNVYWNYSIALYDERNSRQCVCSTNSTIQTKTVYHHHKSSMSATSAKNWSPLGIVVKSAPIMISVLHVTKSNKRATRRNIPIPSFAPGQVGDCPVSAIQHRIHQVKRKINDNQSTSVSVAWRMRSNVAMPTVPSFHARGKPFNFALKSLISKNRMKRVINHTRNCPKKGRNTKCNTCRQVN